MALLIQELTNCVSSWTDNNKEVSRTQANPEKIVVTANEGYAFSSGSVKINGNANFGGIQKNYNNAKTVVITVYSSSGNDIRLTADATTYSKTAKINFESTLINSTCNIPNGLNPSNESYTVILSANDGYTFKEPPTLTYPYTGSTEQLTSTIRENGTRALFDTFSLSGTNGKVSITGIAKSENKTIPINQNLTNCTSDYLQSTVILNTAFTVKITANEGYIFNTKPTLYYLDERGSQKYIDGNLSEDKLSITFSNIIIYEDVNNQRVNINAVADAISEISEIYPFINVYNPSDKQLLELSTKRFYKNTGQDIEVIDLGGYIVNLIKIFVNVPNGNETNIKLYNIDTTVKSNVVTSQKIITDCGTCNVEGEYKNNADLEKSNLYIYLPFLGIQNLEIKRYYNKDVTLQYVTDVLTGDSTIILSADDCVLDTFDCNVSIQVPYIISNFNIAYRGSINGNSKALLGYVPYFIFEYPISIDNDNIKDTSNRNLISAFTGFNSFDNFTIDFECTENEKTEIENLLKEGVIL